MTVPEDNTPSLLHTTTHTFWSRVTVPFQSTPLVFPASSRLFSPPIRQKGAQHGFQPPLGASELSTPHSFARQIAQTWVLRPYHPEDGTPPQIRYQGS